MAKVVVTGGGGFLGRALCARLIADGHLVFSVARSEYPTLSAMGVTTIRLDITSDFSKLKDIFSGAEVVFHTAAKVEMWGKPNDFFSINVEGSRNVIKACLECGVPDLVFTSSPSVISGGATLRNANEEVPYPARFLAEYPRTKALAEQAVLSANSAVLRTVALRPHLIFGPGDTSLIRAVLEKARRGALVRIGSGENLVDFNYIDDCVEAHILAWRALDRNSAARGRAYFISQGEPVKLWWWIDEVLKRSGLSPIEKRVPKAVAYGLAGISEIIAALTGKEPRLTRFLVHEMASEHYFDISAARRDLGYAPRYTVQQGLDLTFGTR